MPHDGHEHGAHDHPHPHQPDAEDTPYTRHMLMAEAVGRLLVAKDVFSADDLRRQIELQDSKTPELGARLVAKAWCDGAFKERLLSDVNAAAGELGIDAGTIPIRAVENTANVHNVIVCTLCSCYPRQLIGLPPDWYKSRAYRARTVREPRAVLAEFGTLIGDHVQVRVHDSTADLRYMVLPKRPSGTDAFTEADLARLVTRDSMIGVSLARTPGSDAGGESP